MKTTSMIHTLPKELSGFVMLKACVTVPWPFILSEFAGGK